MIQQTRAALLEIGGAHTECLYSQLLFLKNGGYHVTLICNEKLRSQTAALGLADELLYFPLEGKSKWEEWRQLLKIRRHIIRNSIHTVIFNTAQSARIRNLLLLPYPQQTTFAGTVHQISKFKKSGSQRSISRKVKKYFVLNDYLLPFALPLLPATNAITSYYPIFFPQQQPTASIDKPEGSFWICIPGHIEYKRRDYEMLVTTWAGITNKPDYTFVLGNARHGDGNKLKSLIHKMGVSSNFILFDGFVSDEVQQEYVQKCDVVMPLIHPEAGAQSMYLNEQISGNFNLAFAFRKPLLMHNAFAGYEDFKDNAVFYVPASLHNTLIQLPDAIRSIAKNSYCAEKWNVAYQTTRYLQFLLNNSIG